jgi:hypothetical protein
LIYVPYSPNLYIDGGLISKIEAVSVWPGHNRDGFYSSRGCNEQKTL